MGKEFIYIAFLLFFLLLINWAGGINSMYQFLLLIFLGVMIIRIDDIKEMIDSVK